MTTNSLIDKLRRRIKDDRPNIKALSLSVTDTAAERAIAEVIGGRLMVKVTGGETESIDFRLDDPRYATVGRLHNAISRQEGYSSQLDEDAQADHMALDLSSMAPTDIGRNRSSLSLTHHLFSDSELEEVIESAVQRHNPRFTVLTLPEGEEAFVLMLAQADICRRQAYDVSKRRGLDTEVSDLTGLANSLEQAYERDVVRLTRALVSPAEPVPSTMGPGDVVVGTAYRSSLRTGKKSPFAAQPGPTAPVFVDPDPEDVEDENVRIHWARSGENDFHHFELWMDTVPDVRAGIDDGRSQTLTQSPPIYYHYENQRRGTSQQIFQLTGHAIMGQGARSYVVRELEPDTDYYFRLAVRDGSGGYAESEVMNMRTKGLRTRFRSSGFASVLYGPPNTLVTLSFDPTKAPITDAHVIRLGDKTVAFQVVDAFTATMLVPQFTQTRLAKFFVVESPNGLRDSPMQPFQVT